MRPKKVILLVDDHEQALDVRAYLLLTRGYKVERAHEAEDALERFREGGIDLVVTDFIMPNIDGVELARLMKKHNHEVPIILISGTATRFEEHPCSVDAYLPKGANSPMEMLERIRLLIARKRGPKKKVLRSIPKDGVAA